VTPDARAAAPAVEAAATAPTAPTPPSAGEDAAALANMAPIIEARDALRRRDAAKLAALAASTSAANHPQASWVAYWELTNRLNGATVDEVEAFYTRWRGRYVEDRLRNDWLLELGRRRDWPAFTRDFPRFRMNDDREVTCYSLLTQHLAGQPVKAAAMEAWLEQRDADDGCHLMAATLVDAQVFNNADVWVKVRAAIDASRLRAVTSPRAQAPPADATWT
jgi:soluble lytic murein transglycosylase